MPLRREFETNLSTTFLKPLRAIFSGSSQSGKTYLIGEILKNQERLFGETFHSVHYYYPEYLDECPVDWHEVIHTPISYNPGFPTKDEILQLAVNSLIIIDDNMAKVVKSELMRQLFNVISGKKHISIICVTQNYFTQGIFSRDIRNSTNYVILFRNCADASLNRRVAKAFGLAKAFAAAEIEFEQKIYPYIFIDQTQRAQISNYRLYTNILNKYQIAYSITGMKGYILSETDFKLAYRIIERKEKSVVAVLNANPIEENFRSSSVTKKAKKDKMVKTKTIDSNKSWKKFSNYY